jgi:hypothetical protein
MKEIIKQRYGQYNTEKQSSPIFIAVLNTLISHYHYYLSNFGSERVAAFRLIGPLFGSRTRLSIGILLNKQN